MTLLSTVILIATVAGLVAGCAYPLPDGSGAPSSMDRSDRAYCERVGGRWVAGVCETPRSRS